MLLSNVHGLRGVRFSARTWCTYNVRCTAAADVVKSETHLVNCDAQSCCDVWVNVSKRALGSRACDYVAHAGLLNCAGFRPRTEALASIERVTSACLGSDLNMIENLEHFVAGRLHCAHFCTQNLVQHEYLRNIKQGSFDDGRTKAEQCQGDHCQASRSCQCAVS